MAAEYLIHGEPWEPRVLSNLPLPTPPGFRLQSFGDYAPAASSADPPWSPSRERRPLSRILAAIPPDRFPDILLFRSPEYLPLPPDIASFPGLKVLLITDWNVSLRFLRDICPLFDFCFTDLRGVELLSRLGLRNIHHQPLFGPVPKAFRHLNLPRDIDISFCGNFNPALHRDRNRLLHALLRLSSKRRIHIATAFGADYVEVLNRSRLVFNYSVRGEANMRSYEAMACGAIPLCEEGNREMPLLFKPGLHYLPYPAENPEGLLRIVEDTLSRPGDLEEKREAALLEVGNHSADLQLAKLLRFAVASACKAGWIPPSKARHPEAPAAGIAPSAALRSLHKLTALGSGFPLAEAFGYLHLAGKTHPALSAETLPALAAALLVQRAEGEKKNPVSKEPSKASGPPLASAPGPMPPFAPLRLLYGYLDLPGLPPHLRSFLRLFVHFAEGEAAAEGGNSPLPFFDPALLAARETLTALDALPPVSPAVPSFYGYLHHPLSLGAAFNTDLNRAYALDAPRGVYSCYAALLRCHCLGLLCRMQIRLGRSDEAARAISALEQVLSDIRPMAFVSLAPARLRLHHARAFGSREEVRICAQRCLAESPLDREALKEALEACRERGLGPEAEQYLREAEALAEILPRGRGEWKGEHTEFRAMKLSMPLR